MTRAYAASVDVTSSGRVADVEQCSFDLCDTPLRKMTTSMEEVVMALPQVEIGARPVRVIGAGKGRLSSTGEPMIFVALGERIGPLEYLALSVADAARLSGQLGDALRVAPPSIDRRSDMT